MVVLLALPSALRLWPQQTEDGSPAPGRDAHALPGGGSQWFCRRRGQGDRAPRCSRLLPSPEPSEAEPRLCF